MFLLTYVSQAVKIFMEVADDMNFIEIEYRERNDSWRMSELQSHDYYELYFLLDGDRNFFYGDKMFGITGPAFCIIPPFAMHKTAGGRYRRININISSDLLTPQEREFLEMLSESVAFSLDHERAALPLSLVKEAAEISVVDTQKKQQLSLSFLHTILYILSKGRLVPLEHHAKSTSSTTDTLMLEVVSYLNTAYAEELNLNNISERFYISKNTLCARFRAAMSCSPMQYLAFVRLSRAKELLSTTKKSIDEISALCGYSSPNYFSLIFKRSVGISPREYRKTK